MRTSILSWLRQTTTVQGLAALACTVALQLTASVSWQVVLGGAVASLVLLVLPGQGDLSRKIGQISADVATVAVTKGNTAAVEQLAKDGMVLLGAKPPAMLREAPVACGQGPQG